MGYTRSIPAMSWTIVSIFEYRTVDSQKALSFKAPAAIKLCYQLPWIIISTPVIMTIPSHFHGGPSSTHSKVNEALIIQVCNYS